MVWAEGSDAGRGGKLYERTICIALEGVLGDGYAGGGGNAGGGGSIVIAAKQLHALGTKVKIFKRAAIGNLHGKRRR